ncbi:hypothetical protein RIF29_24902 [Crotalaria pallida]|uniref:Uncharacterized protein n=1 Tax=Crotalaria pallida TaxID=3830 RepID=A0AAN9HX08_CROPI
MAEVFKINSKMVDLVDGDTKNNDEGYSPLAGGGNQSNTRKYKKGRVPVVVGRSGVFHSTLTSAGFGLHCVGKEKTFKNAKSHSGNYLTNLVSTSSSQCSGNMHEVNGLGKCGSLLSLSMNDEAIKKNLEAKLCRLEMLQQKIVAYGANEKMSSAEIIAWNSWGYHGLYATLKGTFFALPLMEEAWALLKGMKLT